MSNQTTIDRDDIRELLAGYALSLDCGNVDRCVELFDEEGEFVVYGRVYRAPHELRAMFESAPPGLHHTGSASIHVDGDTARVTSQMLFVDARTHTLRPALYTDELCRRGSEWKFRRRECRFLTSDGLSERPDRKRDRSAT